MKKKILTLIGLIILIIPAHALYRVYYPYYRDLKELHYATRLKANGRVLFTEDVLINTVSFDNQAFLVTRARSTATSGGISKQTTSYYMLDNDYLTAYSHGIETTQNGKIISSLQFNYDWANNFARYFFADWQKKKEQKNIFKLQKNEVVFSRDTTLLFPSLLISKESEAKLKIILPSGHEVSVNAVISKQPEEITISGKPLSCYRIELRSGLAFLSIFTPKITFWYLAAPPFNFVRYEGPLGGLFSPTVIQEQII